MKTNYKNMISFVWVKDMNRALTFYTQTLGLNVIIESEGWIEMAIPGTSNAYLAINQWKDTAPLPINQFVTLGVENLDAYRAGLVADDVHMKGDVVEFADEGLRMFKFADPDGNILTVSQVV